MGFPSPAPQPDAQPPLALRPPGYERVGRPPAPCRKTDLRGSVLRFLRPAASGLRGWGGGKSSPTPAHHRGRDRATETLWRLASGPDGLIPAIKIASEPASPAPACRRSIRCRGLRYHERFAYVVPRVRGAAPVFDHDHRHACALLHVSAAARRLDFMAGGRPHRAAADRVRDCRPPRTASGACPPDLPAMAGTPPSLASARSAPAMSATLFLPAARNRYRVSKLTPPTVPLIGVRRSPPALRACGPRVAGLRSWRTLGAALSWLYCRGACPGSQY